MDNYDLTDPIKRLRDTISREQPEMDAMLAQRGRGAAPQPSSAPTGSSGRVLATLRTPSTLGRFARGAGMVGAGIEGVSSVADMTSNGLNASNAMRALGATAMGAAPFTGPAAPWVGGAGLAASLLGNAIREDGPGAQPVGNWIDHDTGEPVFSRPDLPAGLSGSLAPLRETIENATERGVDEAGGPAVRLQLPERMALPVAAPLSMAAPVGGGGASRSVESVMNFGGSPAGAGAGPKLENTITQDDVVRLAQLARNITSAADPFAALMQFRAAMLPSIAAAAGNKVARDQHEIDLKGRAQDLAEKKQSEDAAMAQKRLSIEEDSLAARIQAERENLAARMGIAENELSAKLGMHEDEINMRLMLADINADKSPYEFREVGGGQDASGLPLPKSLAIANKRTGEVRYAEGAQPGAAASGRFVKDKIYKDKNGNMARFNGETFDPL